jgi:hypothetical protein
LHPAFAYASLPDASVGTVSASIFPTITTSWIYRNLEVTLQIELPYFASL